MWFVNQDLKLLRRFNFMDFIFSVMFIISFVAVLIISGEVIYLLKKLIDSRYRNCEICFNEDQFKDLIYYLDELVRR